MLNIISHKENANKKHELPLHTHQDGSTKKQTKQKTSVDKDTRKTETLYSAGGTVKMVQLLWKTVWKFLQKLNIELIHDHKQFQS